MAGHSPCRFIERIAYGIHDKIESSRLRQADYFAVKCISIHKTEARSLAEGIAEMVTFDGLEIGDPGHEDLPASPETVHRMREDTSYSDAHIRCERVRVDFNGRPIVQLSDRYEIVRVAIMIGHMTAVYYVAPQGFDQFTGTKGAMGSQSNDNGNILFPDARGT